MSNARGMVNLAHRGVLAISGEDRKSFLQGLISNDINKLSPDHAIHAAFLTPQGKFLHDLFLVERGETILIDAEKDRLEDLKRRLSLYKLRSKVSIERADDLGVFACPDLECADALGLDKMRGQSKDCLDGKAFIDPRLAEIGCRLILPNHITPNDWAEYGLQPIDFREWDKKRIYLGLADGSRDMPVEKAILLENGFDELGSVDFEKGCYMGQELTARTKWRGLVRKRLMPVEIDGPTPDAGTLLLLDGVEAGEMRSSVDGVGLALIRLDHFAKAVSENKPLSAGKATLFPRKPDWMTFPEAS